MTTQDRAVQDRCLDKFYTILPVSAQCLTRVGELYAWNEWGLVVEPSAGAGSFYTQIPTQHKVGLDISPDHPDVIAQDFFTYAPPAGVGRVLVVGNPPFGRVCSIAIRFFNHAAAWADVIAFIVPRTFRRVSVQNKLCASFHLVHDEDIPTHPCAFRPQMMAKCCFQVWEKRDALRAAVSLPTTHPDWNFLAFGSKDSNGQPTPPTGADFAVRAYGGKCGEIVAECLDILRPKSWHWIRTTRVPKEVLMERFCALDYSQSLDTARQNSLGRGDLVKLYSDKYD